eukprot:m.102278 g.102278  ORF g.102278 m.102278 type:complete len:310 (+) comp37162_c0_seq1:66-995(+)
MDVLADLLGFPAAASTVSHDMKAFREVVKKSRHILVLSGAGISAESGIPTFRGEGGYWRKYQATDLATMDAFTRNPSLVWEFYSYRREVARSKEPNKAHYAIAQLEERFRQENEGRTVTVITQNIDRLHNLAGSKNVLELHGSLCHTRCTKCGTVEENNDSPICPALEGKGAPDVNTPEAQIPVESLPQCNKCQGLLRPHVVWFGESLFPEVLSKVDSAMEKADVCLVVGTSSIVYPAAAFAPVLSSKGVPVAEFNIEMTPATGSFRFHFCGKAGELLPIALAKEDPSDEILKEIEGKVETAEVKDEKK